jgi:hypothetical protein
VQEPPFPPPNHAFTTTRPYHLPNMKAARRDLARHPSPFNAHAVNHTKPRRGPPAPTVAQQPEHRFAAPFRPHSGSVPGTSSRHDPVSVPRAVAPAEEASQDELVGEYCMPAYVSVDNVANANFTVLEVEVQDYPGALGWLLVDNGLSVGLPSGVLLVYHNSHNFSKHRLCIFYRTDAGSGVGAQRLGRSGSKRHPSHRPRWCGTQHVLALLPLGKEAQGGGGGDGDGARA